MIKRVCLVLALLCILSFLASATDFRLYKDGNEIWIIQILDPDNPEQKHIITVKMNGKILYKEVNAFHNDRFTTNKRGEMPPTIRIEEED